MLVAILALVFSVTGAAGAATGYVITSKRQIAPKLLRQLEQRGPRGSRGQPGAAGKAGAAGGIGPTGATGPTGKFSASNLQIVWGPGAYVPPNTSTYTNATCPAGAVAISGGYQNGNNTVVTADERASDGTGWYIYASSSGSSGGQARAFAVCSA